MKATLLFIFALLCSLPLSAQQYQENSYRGSVGLGVGMLYGLSPGIKADYRVAEDVTLNFGIGTDSSIPIVGAQYHFRSQNQFWQPRVGLHYGVVDTWAAMLPVSEDSDAFYQKNYRFKSAVLEWGQSLNFNASRRHGLDVALSLSLGGDQRRKKQKELGLSRGWFDGLDQFFYTFNIGYRYNF